MTLAQVLNQAIESADCILQVNLAFNFILLEQFYPLRVSIKHPTQSFEPAALVLGLVFYYEVCLFYFGKQLLDVIDVPVDVLRVLGKLLSQPPVKVLL